MPTTFLTAGATASLTLNTRRGLSMAASAASRAILITDVGYTESQPYPLVGSSGTVYVPATPGSPTGFKHLEFTAPYKGSLTMEVTSPAGLPVEYLVRDAGGDELEVDSGELNLVLGGGEYALITLRAPESVESSSPSEWVDIPLESFIVHQGTYDSGTNVISGDMVTIYTDQIPLDGQNYQVEITYGVQPASYALDRVFSPTDPNDLDSINTGFSWWRIGQTGVNPFIVGPAGNFEYQYAQTAEYFELVGMRWRNWDGVFTITGVRYRPLSSNIDDALTVEWSYAKYVDAVLQASLENDIVDSTPTMLQVSIANARPNDVVTFSTVGPTTLNDFATVTVGEYGELIEHGVDVSALQVGEYVLRVESHSSGSIDLPFTVLEAPLGYGGISTADPERPTEPVVRWTFVDIRDSATRWTMQRNPAAWSNLNPPNDFTHQATTARDGRILTWEAGSRPWRIEFTGWIDDREEYERFVQWADLRRRLWLIDHRQRAWLVTIEHFDAKAQVKPNLPWAHEYTVRALVFKRED